MQRLSLMLIALFASAGLTACGGGSNDNAGAASTAAPATTTTTATATPVNADCPTGYKSISMDKSSVRNASMSLSSGDATFSFNTPATDTPSIKVCLGVATTPFVPAGGLQTAGKTYDLKVIALDSSNATLASLLKPSLVISAAKADLPAGTTPQTAAQTAGIYTDSDGGLASLPVSLRLTDSSGLTLGSAVAKQGRFVIAYKP